MTTATASKRNEAPRKGSLSPIQSLMLRAARNRGHQMTRWESGSHCMICKREIREEPISKSGGVKIGGPAISERCENRRKKSARGG
jgi:hypothetical protein